MTFTRSPVVEAGVRRATVFFVLGPAAGDDATREEEQVEGGVDVEAALSRRMCVLRGPQRECVPTRRGRKLNPSQHVHSHERVVPIGAA